MKTLSVLFFFICFSGFSQALKVEEVDLGMQVRQQFTPHPTNTAYFTRTTNHTLVSGGMIQQGHVGPQIKLSWKSTPTTVYTLRWSTNLTSWKEIPVHFVGDGNPIVWYQNPPSNHYRLVIVSNAPPASPANLKVIP